MSIRELGSRTGVASCAPLLVYLVVFAEPRQGVRVRIALARAPGDETYKPG